MTQQADLVQVFPPKYIHTNPSGGGSYVAHHVINQRLIEVLGAAPTFEMVEVIRGDVPGIEANPSGSSKRAKDGRPALQGAVVGVVARMRVGIDGKDVTVEEVGDCEDPHNWPHDGARLKDAISDAYKRCAMRLGCGLHLWSQDEFYLHDHLKSGGGSTAKKPAGSTRSKQEPPPESPRPAEKGSEEGAGAGTAPPPPDLEGPATEEQWKRAIKVLGNRGKVMKTLNQRFKVATADKATKAQLAAVIEEAVS